MQAVHTTHISQRPITCVQQWCGHIAARSVS